MQNHLLPWARQGILAELTVQYGMPAEAVARQRPSDSQCARRGTQHKRYINVGRESSRKRYFKIARDNQFARRGTRQMYFISQYAQRGTRQRYFNSQGARRGTRLRYSNNERESSRTRRSIEEENSRQRVRFGETKISFDRLFSRTETRFEFDQP